MQRLASMILAILTPLVEAGTTLLPPADAEPGRCQQLWCPVCATAAVASGEQHPLVTLVAEHGAAMLSIVRAMVHPENAGPPPAGPPPDDTAAPSPTTSGYQPIHVTVHDATP